MIIVISSERFFSEIEGYLPDIVRDNSTFAMEPLPNVYLTNQEPEEPVQPPDEPLFPPEEPPIFTHSRKQKQLLYKFDCFFK